jgi:hypothetical protein
VGKWVPAIAHAMPDATGQHGTEQERRESLGSYMGDILGEETGQEALGYLQPDWQRAYWRPNHDRLLASTL